MIKADKSYEVTFKYLNIQSAKSDGIQSKYLEIKAVQSDDTCIRKFMKQSLVKFNSNNQKI